jgi:hypothetical protein
MEHPDRIDQGTAARDERHRADRLKAKELPETRREARPV